MIKSRIKKFFYSIPFVLITAAVAARGCRTIQTEQIDIQAHRHSVSRPEGWSDAWTVKTVVSRNGLKLACWFASSSNHAYIILVHGYGADRAQLWPEAQLLQSHGFGILLCDSRAHGESEGQVITYGQEEQYDIIDLVNWLQAETQEDSPSMGGYGFSIGGLALALAASSDQRLAAVVLASTPSSLSTLICDEHQIGCWLDSPFVLWTLWRYGINPWPLSVKAEIHKVAPRPILFVHGARDIIVPPKRMQENFSAAAEPKQAIILSDRAHGDFYRTKTDQYALSLLELFQTHLTTHNSRAQ